MPNNSTIGYVGTYTKGDSKGIYAFSLDTAEKKLSKVKVAAILDNPTYITITQDNQTLYSVIKKSESGGVAAFSINDESGELVERNNQLESGPSPCHVSVNHDNDCVVTANYHKGTVESYATNKEDGTVCPPFSTVAHVGSGPNQERQEKPHVHYAGFTPDEKFVVVVDLGIDKVMTYRHDKGKLTEVNSLSVKPGSGPRHLVFHPYGEYAYIMTELSSEVIVLKYNADNGSFTELQYISTIPVDFDKDSFGSAIHISSDGSFLYAANRGHDSIAVFGIDQDSGELTFLEHSSTEGNWPRDFALDPTEKFIIASNQNSGNLVLFSRNESTGKLNVLQSDIAVPDPVCVKFLTI